MLVSIIICTRNRAKFLSLCLDSIASSIRFVPDSSNCEIILVNNGSTDDTLSVVDQWSSANPDISLRVISEQKVGLSNARNTGMAAARGDIFIWTDDDCRMAPQYIIKALDYDAKDTAPVIRGGRIELGDKDDLPLTIKTSDQIARWSKADRSARVTSLCGSISGANIVVRRSVVDLLGPCDVRLGAGTRISGSEDTDYLCRAYTEGVIIEYVPDLVVFHFHGRRTKDQGRKLLKNYNVGAGAVYIKHVISNFDLFRPFIWNIKNARNEIRQSRNLYLPEYDLSYKNILVLNIYGMCLYIFYSVWDKLPLSAV